MRTIQQMSIALPNDMADAVKAGEYASESEVTHDGLHVIIVGDQAVETWLQNQISPAYDALVADPTRAVAVEQVRARLAAEHARTQ